VKGVHDRHRVGKLFGGGGLEAGEPVHRDGPHGVAPCLGPVGQPLLERLRGAALNHVQQACSSTPTTRTPSNRAASRERTKAMGLSTGIRLVPARRVLEAPYSSPRSSIPAITNVKNAAARAARIATMSEI
jgi:hypothetical protein